MRTKDLIKRLKELPDLQVKIADEEQFLYDIEDVRYVTERNCLVISFDFKSQR